MCKLDKNNDKIRLLGMTTTENGVSKLYGDDDGLLYSHDHFVKCDGIGSPMFLYKVRLMEDYDCYHFGPCVYEFETASGKTDFAFSLKGINGKFKNKYLVLKTNDPLFSEDLLYDKEELDFDVNVYNVVRREEIEGISGEGYICPECRKAMVKELEDDDNWCDICWNTIENCVCDDEDFEDDEDDPITVDDEDDFEDYIHGSEDKLLSDDIEHTIDMYEEYCNDIVRLFCEKQGYDFIEAQDTWVGGEVGTICNINEMYVDMFDIYYDLKEQIEPGMFEEWYWDNMDNSRGIKINYKTYCKMTENGEKPDTKTNLLPTLVCNLCGGDKVQVLAWMDANTLEYINEYDEYDTVGYCESCNTNVDLVLEEDCHVITVSTSE